METMRMTEDDINACSRERQRMVERQIMARGITDKRVIDAMLNVPRHLFLSAENISAAYDDHPMPIACGQTVSQPYMVAAMTELLSLEGREHVLEIGTGAGYQTAILARLARCVISVERHAALADSARQRLDAMGCTNVIVVVGDGTLGCLERAPYDAILVTAGAPEVPDTLRRQLADGGRLVAPVGNSNMQRLVKIERHGDEFALNEGMACRFVPLIGVYGWPDAQR